MFTIWKKISIKIVAPFRILILTERKVEMLYRDEQKAHAQYRGS